MNDVTDIKTADNVRKLSFADDPFTNGQENRAAIAQGVYTPLAAGEQERGLGFVEPHEEAEAKRLIDEEFIKLTGKPFNYRATNWYIHCKLYIRPEEISSGVQADGTPYKILRPTASTDMDKYHSVVGLVLSVGPLAFRDKSTGQVQAGGAPYRVGDWVVLPRHESNITMYRGVAIATIPDDRILGVIDEPADLMPVTLADRI